MRRSSGTSGAVISQAIRASFTVARVCVGCIGAVYRGDPRLTSDRVTLSAAHLALGDGHRLGLAGLLAGLGRAWAAAAPCRCLRSALKCSRHLERLANGQAGGWGEVAGSAL